MRPQRRKHAFETAALTALMLLLALHGAAAVALALDFTLGAEPLERCNSGSAGGGRAAARASAAAFFEPAPFLDAENHDR
jgi:hypothetical protein